MDQGVGVGRVFSEYEVFKKQHQDTERQCQEQGFSFEPLVVEAHGGGWSGTLRKVVDNLALRQKTVWSDSPEPASLRIAQRLSICLQAENARAVLKRMSAPEAQGASEEEAAWDVEEVEEEKAEEGSH